MSHIIFYDIPSTARIPYETEWVESADIEAKCKEMGAPPTTKNPDGTPLYTLPAIYDPSTGAVVSESTEIAVYLDAAYPNTPKLIIPGSRELQREALDFHFEAGSMQLRQFTIPAAYRVINPRSQAFFRTKEAFIGMTIEEFCPSGKRREEEWAKLKKEFSIIASRLPRKQGLYIMGSEICYLDFMVASHLISMKKLFGENSSEWNDIKTWDSGRWGKILKSVEKYEIIV
ncbi:hypothetical protein BDZ94DRAFT_1289576 [Collybia nuda]|uniref:GST N-terminal domain-containing protein n=1 Tax=Collybia nuda TaxID=64659 RepID=A0A9P6CKP2_9AGAR|nr:hypothetical protein BDZ94DRAFT_1289576 [Collybia nuda]